MVKMTFTQISDLVVLQQVNCFVFFFLFCFCWQACNFCRCYILLDFLASSVMCKQLLSNTHAYTHTSHLLAPSLAHMHIFLTFNAKITHFYTPTHTHIYTHTSTRTHTFPYNVVGSRHHRDLEQSDGTECGHWRLHKVCYSYRYTRCVLLIVCCSEWELRVWTQSVLLIHKVCNSFTRCVLLKHPSTVRQACGVRCKLLQSRRSPPSLASNARARALQVWGMSLCRSWTMCMCICPGQCVCFSPGQWVCVSPGQCVCVYVLDSGFVWVLDNMCVCVC